MRDRIRSWGALAVTIAALPACNLLTDLDALGEGGDRGATSGAGGSVGGSGGDGSNGGSGGTGPGGTGPGGSGPGGSGPGGSGPGGGGSGGGGPGGGGAGGAASMCPALSFCDDFDQGPLGSTWSGATALDGKLMLDGTIFVSAPAAFRASLDPVAAVVQRTAFLNEKFAAAPGLVCEFDFYLDSKTGGEDTRIAQVLPDTQEFSGYNFNLWLRGDGSGQLEEWACFPPGCSNSFIHQAPFTQPIPKQWVHIVLQVNYAASATVTIDGALAASLDMYDQMPAGMTFYLGAQGDGVGPFELLYDNVVCTPLP